MLSYARYTLANLPESHWTFWRECMQLTWRGASPCFAPEFVQAFAAVGRKIEILAVEDAGSVVGLLPIERDGWNLAYPVGRELADFQGLIHREDPTVNWSCLLQACGLRGWQYSANLQSQLAPGLMQLWPSPYIDLSSGFSAYCRVRKSAGSDTIEKTQQKQRAWSRLGTVRFELRNNSEAYMQQLLKWKQRQYSAQQIMIPLTQWRVAELWRYWIEQRTDAFEGLLSVLWWNEHPAALAYSLRNGGIAHCCFLSYEPKFAKYSPGLILLLEMSAALASESVQELHLGRGHERFKSSLATHAQEVAEGVTGATTWETQWLQAWQRSRQRMKQSTALRWLRSLQLPREHSTSVVFPSSTTGVRNT